MSEMPPTHHQGGLPNWNSSSGGDVEMVEYANANGVLSEEKHPNTEPKVGDWDDRELMSRPREGW